MSGGSHNYMSLRYPECSIDDLDGMIARLRELGYADAADASERVLVCGPSDALRDVWHAVEWFDSCDWGLDSVERAIAAWRKTVEA